MGYGTIRTPPVTNGCGNGVCNALHVGRFGCCPGSFLAGPMGGDTFTAALSVGFELDGRRLPRPELVEHIAALVARLWAGVARVSGRVPHADVDESFRFGRRAERSSNVAR